MYLRNIWSLGTCSKSLDVLIASTFYLEIFKHIKLTQIGNRPDKHPSQEPKMPALKMPEMSVLNVVEILPGRRPAGSLVGAVYPFHH